VDKSKVVTTPRQISAAWSRPTLSTPPTIANRVTS